MNMHSFTFFIGYSNAFAILVTSVLIVSDVVHWIFAFKYWALAWKVQLLKDGKNPDQYNMTFTCVFIAGLTLNIVGGAITSLSFYPAMITLDDSPA